MMPSEDSGVTGAGSILKLLEVVLARDSVDDWMSDSFKSL